MALKPVTKEAYAGCMAILAAGEAAWLKWQQNGGGTWPVTDPSARWMEDILFQYVPTMAVAYTNQQKPDNCPTEEERRPQYACFALHYDNVFSPQNVINLRAALNARTPPDIIAEFVAAGMPADGGDLEWWATAIAAGTLIAIGGLPFAGAALVKVVGYLLAAWIAYGFIVPKTEAGKSIAEKWMQALKDGFDKAMQGAAAAGKIVIGVGVVAVLWALFGRGR